MYEDYSPQALPSKRYRELLGSALCVFNSNSAFVIEMILKNDSNNKHTWHKLMNQTAGKLRDAIPNTITKNSDDVIFEKFRKITDKRDRIVHSFQITDDGTDASDDPDKQILATKDKQDIQYVITEEFLLDFIKENGELSSEIHKFRGY